MPPRFSLHTDLTLGVNACTLSTKKQLEIYKDDFKKICGFIIAQIYLPKIFLGMDG
jgi:hypothetical protein